jgi:NAD(P)-dependent dehydrogenase (short-subunit alcohol dehydrogenase family)
MLGRATTLSCGAAGGLFLLFSHSPLVTLALAFFLGWSWLQDWLRGPMCPSTARLDGKLAVVTGSNTGIGRETAKGLAARGARVVLACRNVKQAEEVAAEIESAGGKAEVMELDLQSFASVRRFAAALASKFPKLDILVNNAGVAFQPKQMTKDGEEQVMQVNHLSPFLLTNLLLDMLNAAGKARVVNLSSLMHTWAKEGIQWDDLKWEKKSFDSWSAYAQSKLANIYFTRELARRQGSKSGVTVYAVHPGAVDSDLGRSYRDKIPAFVRKYLTDFVKVFLKTSEHGAQTSIYCAVEQALEKETGKYYADCMRIAPAAFALDDKQAKKLWEVSKSIVGDLSPLKPTGQEEIGSVFYSHGEEGNRSTHSHLMTEIKAFPEDSVLAPTKCAEPVGGAGLLVQEMMVRDVENAN